MSKISFYKLHKTRKQLLFKNKDNDFCVIDGQNKVLISSPHGVPQVRLGKPKVAEPGSLATALALQQGTNSFLIAKTKNTFVDANFDEITAYKLKVFDLIEKEHIKYFLDFHGLAAHRTMDVNLGVHMGQNIETNPSLLDNLHKTLEDSGFVVSIDKPFWGSRRTLTGSVKNKFEKVWTIQIEINCSITNNKENFDKWQKLLGALSSWINKLR